MKDVFMVRLDWSTTDADGIDTELHEDYDEAYDRYKEIITGQLKNFWDGEVVFDTDGDPGKDYEFSEEDNNSNESEVYWHLSLKDDYYFHTFVDLLACRFTRNMKTAPSLPSVTAAANILSRKARKPSSSMRAPTAMP